MPKSNAPSEPTDGNTAQWDKVKSMRDRQGAVERGESTGTPIKVIGLGDAAPPAESESGDQPRDPETGRFTREAAPEAPPADAPPLADAAPKEAAPLKAPAAPQVREVEIDGMKVNLAPELADAFERAEKITKEVAATAERDKLKDELREELRKELAPPAKSDAELAAERALAEAERLKNAPKKPAHTLLIENPEEYENQRDAYEEWRTQEAIRRAKDEALDAVRVRDQATAVNAEQQARAIVREQFYDAYPVLKDSADIVDIMLTKSFDEIVSSGRLNKPMTPAEREAAKKQLFAGVATQATRRLVNLMSGGKKVAPPAETPPNLVASAPRQERKPAEPKEEKSKAKYPKGSISAVLAERRAKLMGTSA